MSNIKPASLILIFFVFCAVDHLQADSIWSKRDQNKKDLYADDKARHIGDVLTITISEESTVDNKAKRTLSKETTRDQDFDGQVGIEHILPEIPAFKFGVGSTYSNTLDGKSDYKDEREFTDSISVIVIDIMPNGNLVIFGTRDRDIANDIQTIEVSGIVRPSDIAFDNTIRSEQVANFSLTTHNKGVGAQYMRPNWLGRIFDIIWPF
ncbi:MAG: flagellar basal body L-ring protein FlgH [Planctomycetota bacterium]|jgi:flagellar L-ring protein precursor FlgH